jgi:hypothetical protein
MATVSFLPVHELEGREKGVSISVEEVKEGETTSELFISSPYPTSEHHLDLSTVPETSQQLARALQILRPVTKDYQSKPYSTSFNWQEIINLLPANFEGFPSLEINPRGILLHRILLYPPHRHGHLSTPLSRLVGARRSKPVRRITQILVAGS